LPDSHEKSIKTLFLVDGTALVYRAHFAFIRNPLLTSNGQNVSATYGYLLSLLRILDVEKPSLCAVAFDTPEPTFRHRKYTEYKATREKTPDELVAQLPDIKEITKNLGLSVLEMPGWEADDVIGTLAAEAAGQNIHVFMVTGDKDFMQLVTERVQIYKISGSDTDSMVHGVPSVVKKFGVEPGQVIEVMGLMGDSSDNIPGVPGVGEKTAIKLIKEFESIENVYRNLDNISSKALKTKLENNRDLAFLSRELVTINLDVPLKVKASELEIAEKNAQKLRETCIRFEFTSLINRILEGNEFDDNVSKRYHMVDDRKAYEDLINRLKGEQSLVIDLETTSLNPIEAKIVGIALSVKEGEAFYLPANLKEPIFDEPGGDIDRYLRDLSEILSNPDVKICGQNIIYDLLVLDGAGVTYVNNVAFDTMVAHYLLDQGGARHNLDYLSLKYLSVKKIPTTDLIGKGKKQISMADVPVEKVSEYACEDADMTFRLKNIFERELKEKGLMDLFESIEMPLARVLEHMRKNGVRINPEMLKEMSGTLGSRMEQVTETIYDLAGERFNINSPRQLGKLLFDKLEIQKELGIKRVRKTKTGYSTNAAVLETMSSHPLPRAVLEYRQLQKLRSTYVEALPLLVNPSTGRIHASFNQTVTATGRLSSSDPNLQNIPIRTDLGRRIRKAFIPRDHDHVLLSADYSQIELRILAHVSRDPAMIKAFREGKDIHRDTASLIFDVDPENVTSEMRSRAKTINFGIIYGMGPQRLSREIGISFTQAREFISSYFEVFSGVKEYIDRTIDEARRTGYVSTLLGRKRQIGGINEVNRQVKTMAENMAVNTPIQGTAADLIKKAMIDIFREIVNKGLRSALIMQVHDELVLDVPKHELDEMKSIVREKMEYALDLRVPVIVDMGHGRDWLEAH